MMSATVKVELSAQRMARAMQLNANDRTRSAAARLVNSGARFVIDRAEQLAGDELKNDRPPNRRRTSEPRYIDSFYVAPATAEGINRQVAGFGNRSPNARRLEYGTKEHPIRTQRGGANTGQLVFPWDPPHSHSGPRQSPGDWPVEYEDGNRWVMFEVQHPGTPAFHFIRRARDAYRAANRIRHSRR